MVSPLEVGQESMAPAFAIVLNFRNSQGASAEGIGHRLAQSLGPIDHE